MSALRKIEGVLAAFMLAASVANGAAAAVQARDGERNNAVLYGIASATFGAAGALEIYRLRRHPR